MRGLIKTSSAAVYYYLEDHLGTSRAITNSSGSKCYDADFYPFGGERVLTNSCPQNYKFTGKERDAESGNDDYGARYYASSLGRFLSPDWSAIPVPVPYANLSNPQTLNLYAMVSDNPETFADLDGHGQYGGFHLGIIGDAAVPSETSADALAMFEDAMDPSTFGATPDAVSGVANSSAASNSEQEQQPDPQQQTNQDKDQKSDKDKNKDQQQVPADAGSGGTGGGGQGKGERRWTSKPDEPIKGAKPIRDKDGKIIGWRLPTPDGKGKNKSLEWGRVNGLDPNKFQTAAKVGFWATAGAIAIRALTLLGEAASDF